MHNPLARGSGTGSAPRPDVGPAAWRTLAPHAQRAIALVLSLFAPVCTAHAQHAGDIGLTRDDGGRIVTHLISGSALVPERVFTASFGDTGVPNFTQNPGFDAASGTFPATARIGFDFRAPLRRWTGSGFAATDPQDPLLGERLRGSFISLSATTGAGPVAGFSLAVQGDGGWHRHISWTLQPAAGSSVPVAGVYLIELSLWCTDAAVEDSDPFWVVMSAGASAADIELAEQWVRDSIGHSCPADLDDSGSIDGIDLASLLANWGGVGQGDISGDGTVDGVDLAAVLAAWGPCP